jgi:gas vesicle protein
MNNNNYIQEDEENTDKCFEQPTIYRGGMGIGGGLVGAAIGGLLGRRIGGVSGAVVGAVAGALVGKGTSERVNHTVNSLVDAAKSVAEAVNQNVNDVGNTVKDTVEEAKTSVVGVVHAVKDTVEEVKPSVVSTVEAFKDTVEEVQPSVVCVAKNVTEAINHSVIDVENALNLLKTTLNEVTQSVIGVEETTENTDEQVMSGNLNDTVDEHLPNSNQVPVREDFISSLSSNPQDIDFTPPPVSLPAPPPPSTPPVATETGGNFFSEDLGVEFQENNQSFDEPDISQQDDQELNVLQPHGFSEINQKDIKYNNVQPIEKEFQQSPPKTTPPLKPNTPSQTEKIQKTGGIIIGSFIITLIGVTFGFSPKQNELLTKSSASSQSLSPRLEATAKRIPERMTDGWIFLGNIDTSDSVLVGKPFIKSSQSTNSPIVPSVGSLVLVNVQPGVTLRENKPQAPNFNHQEQKALAILKPQEKLKILQLELIKSSNSKSATKVWAKVNRCGNECL